MSKENNPIMTPN